MRRYPLENELKIKHVSKDKKTRQLCRELKITKDERKARIQEELLKLHSGLVNKLAYKFASGTFCSEDIQDAKSEALVNILSLFETYDADGPTAFSTYAYVSLSGVMKNWKKRNLLISLPNNADPQWVAANEGKEIFINPKTGAEENILFSVKAMVNGIHSLDFVTDDSNKSVENIKCDNDDFQKILDNSSLESALKYLSQVEANIVFKYFVEDKSYKQIAKEFGCTHQCIGQHMTRAKNKLKVYYKGTV